MLEALGAAGAGAAAATVLAHAPASGRTGRALVWSCVAAFGVAGLLAAPAATGVGPLDAGLRCVLSAGAVALAARARPWPVVAAAALAVVGAGSPVWPAAAGLGVAAAAAALDARRDPGVGHPDAFVPVPVPALALAAGLAGQAAFRFAWPRPSLATAGLAGLVFAVLCLAGTVRLTPGTRQVVARTAAAVAVVAGMAATTGLVAVVSARPAVTDGMAAATAGLEAAGTGDRVAAARLLDGAARSFATARSRLDAWWARPALAVPVMARHSRALSTVASNGSAVAAAGARTLQAVEQAGLHLDHGAVPVGRLDELRPPVVDARAALATAAKAAAAVRSPWLLPPVGSRVEALAERATATRRELGDALVAFGLVPRLLGADGPRRWFLAIQTPSEARASGGFIGSFGEISADGGRLRLDRVGRTAELNAAGQGAAGPVKAAPDYLARYTRFDIDQLWQNVTMSPDFPSVADAMAGLYERSGGGAIDGVVAIDPFGLAALLSVLGPVEVNGWPEPLTAGTAARVLLFDQYVRLEGDARVDFLGQVVQAVWARLTTTDAGVLDLARAIGPMVTQKHVLVASTHDDGERRSLGGLGISGAMAPVKGDFLGVVTQNAGADKIDWFLRRSVDYQVRFDPATRKVRSTVRVTLRNSAPSTGLPSYVIGGDVTPLTPPGTNKLYLSVYTPLSLAGARVGGTSLPVESELEQDRHVYSTYVSVPAGGSVVVELDLTGEVPVAGDRYRLDLHRQPFLAADEVTSSVRLPEGWRLGRWDGAVSLQSDVGIEARVRRR